MIDQHWGNLGRAPSAVARCDLGHSHAPCLQPRPFCPASKQCMGRLVEHRAQQGIATFGHPAFIVGLARLVALRRQPDMRADRPGMEKTCGWSTVAR